MGHHTQTPPRKEKTEHQRGGALALRAGELRLVTGVGMRVRVGGCACERDREGAGGIASGVCVMCAADLPARQCRGQQIEPGSAAVVDQPWSVVSWQLCTAGRYTNDMVTLVVVPGRTMCALASVF